MIRLYHASSVPNLSVLKCSETTEGLIYMSPSKDFCLENYGKYLYYADFDLEPAIEAKLILTIEHLEAGELLDDHDMIEITFDSDIIVNKLK